MEVTPQSAKLLSDSDLAAADASYQAMSAAAEQGGLTPATAQPAQVVPQQSTPAPQSDVAARLAALQQQMSGQAPEPTLAPAQPDAQVPSQPTQMVNGLLSTQDKSSDTATGQGGEKMAQLEKLMQEVYGITPVQLEQQMQVAYQVQLDNDRRTLQSEWGVDDKEFNTRLQGVHELLKTLPPAAQQELDNIEGARLLYDVLQQRQQKAAAKNVPGFDTSSSAGAASRSGTKPMFTQAELLAMDEKTYQANEQAILYAYQNGLVK